MDLKIRLNTGKAYEDTSQGFCPRCKNFSAQLNDINVCPTCDAEAEKRIIKDCGKSYVKAGKREQVGL